MSKKAVIYCRTSTKGKGQTCDTQLLPLTEYAQRLGYEVFRIYRDEGVSGAKSRRINLDNLLSDAKQRKFQAVIVYDLSRLARSITHLLNCVSLLQSYGVSFISYKENIRTDEESPMSTFTLHVLGAIAQLSRSLLRESVKLGLQRARQQGKVLGRRKVVYDLNKIIHLRESGKTLSEIESVVGISRSKICRILKERKISKTSSNHPSPSP